MSPFYLFDWLVEPEYNKLTRSSESHQLEPLAMDVLVFFANNAEEVISRDQLVDAVWQGRIVGDHAIYRIINQLRKLLDETDEQKYFVTIRKKGYRFVAPVKPCETVNQSKNSLSDTKTEATPEVGESINSGNPPANLMITRKLATGIAVAIAAMVVWFIWMQASNVPLPDFSRTTPVTNLPGEERSPAFSFDGENIAFSYKAARSKNWHIYYQSLIDHSVVQVTTGKTEDMLPKWSPDGRKLAFVRYQGEQCEILIQDIANLIEVPEKVLDCNGKGRLIDLVWGHKGEHLFYTDSESAIEPRRVYRRSLVTGKKTQLTNPEVGKAKGDLKIALSPDGKQLAILRDYNWGDTNVFLFDLETGKERKLFSISGWQLALSWSHDGAYLYYSNEKNTVDAYSINRGTSQVVAKNIEPIGFSVSSPVEQKVAVETGQSAIDIWRLELSKDAQEQKNDSYIVSSEFDLYPTYANTSGRSAFISSRSGNLQVWIREESGREFQLTRFTDGRPIRRIRWSPDDNFLLSDRSKYLYLIDVESGEEKVLTTEDHWALAETSSWSRDGKSVYFSSDVDGDWQIYKMPVEKNGTIEKITEKGGYSAEESLDGKFLYYLKYHQPGLWKQSFDTGVEELVFEDIDVFSNNAWVATEKGIYYFSNDDKQSGIFLYDDSKSSAGSESKPIKKMILSLPPLIKNFSLSNDHSKIIYPKLFQSESSIVLLEPNT